MRNPGQPNSPQEYKIGADNSSITSTENSQPGSLIQSLANTSDGTQLLFKDDRNINSLVGSNAAPDANLGAKITMNQHLSTQGRIASDVPNAQVGMGFITFNPLLKSNHIVQHSTSELSLNNNLFISNTGIISPEKKEKDKGLFRKALNNQLAHSQMERSLSAPNINPDARDGDNEVELIKKSHSEGYTCAQSRTVNNPASIITRRKESLKKNNNIRKDGVSLSNITLRDDRTAPSPSNIDGKIKSYEDAITSRNIESAKSKSKEYSHYIVLGYALECLELIRYRFHLISTALSSYATGKKIAYWFSLMVPSIIVAVLGWYKKEIDSYSTAFLDAGNMPKSDKDQSEITVRFYQSLLAFYLLEKGQVVSKFSDYICEFNRNILERLIRDKKTKDLLSADFPVRHMKEEKDKIPPLINAETSKVAYTTLSIFNSVLPHMINTGFTLYTLHSYSKRLYEKTNIDILSTWATSVFILQIPLAYTLQRILKTYNDRIRKEDNKSWVAWRYVSDMSIQVSGEKLVDRFKGNCIDYNHIISENKLWLATLKMVFSIINIAAPAITYLSLQNATSWVGKGVVAPSDLYKIVKDISTITTNLYKGLNTLFDASYNKSLKKTKNLIESTANIIKQMGSKNSQLPSENAKMQSSGTVLEIDIKDLKLANDITISSFQTNIPEGHVHFFNSEIGRGKTAIFRVIVGDISPLQYKGHIKVNTGNIQYIVQEPKLNPTFKLLDWIFKITERIEMIEKPENKGIKVAGLQSLQEDFTLVNAFLDQLNLSSSMGSVYKLIWFIERQLSSLSLQQETQLNDDDIESVLKAIKKKITEDRTCDKWGITASQTQLLVFIRAVIAKPKLLLMDCPFSHVSERMRGILGDLVIKYASDYNIAFLVSGMSHLQGVQEPETPAPVKVNFNTQSPHRSPLIQARHIGDEKKLQQGNSIQQSGLRVRKVKLTQVFNTLPANNSSNTDQISSNAPTPPLISFSDSQVQVNNLENFTESSLSSYVPLNAENSNVQSFISNVVGLSLQPVINKSVQQGKSKNQ